MPPLVLSWPDWPPTGGLNYPNCIHSPHALKPAPEFARKEVISVPESNPEPKEAFTYHLGRGLRLPDIAGARAALRRFVM